MARRPKKYSPPRGTRFGDSALNVTVKDIYDILNTLGEDRVVQQAVVRSSGGGATPGATWRCGIATMPAASTSVVVVPDPPLSAALNCINSCVTIQVTCVQADWGTMTSFGPETRTETTFTIEADAAPGADKDFFWLAMPCPPTPTIPASIAVWGKQESADTAGLWVFDEADPEGTLVQLFTSATHNDLGRFEYYDGWIYYGTDEGGTPEIWKIRPDGVGDQLVHQGTGTTAGFRISVTYDVENGIFFYWNGNNQVRKWDGSTDSAIRTTSTSECQDLMVQGDGTGLYEIKGAATFRRDYSGTLTHTLSQNSNRGHMDYNTNRFYLRWDSGGTTDNVTSYAEDFTSSEALTTGLLNSGDDYAYDRDYENGNQYVWIGSGPQGSGIYRYDGAFGSQTLVIRFHEATDMRLLKSQY